jgi:transposase
MTRKKAAKKESTEKNEMAFAVEIARGASIAQAAKSVKISETTGYRWARKPELRKAVEDIRSTVLQVASHRLTNIVGKAVDTLERLLDSENENVQLSAARTVIDGTTKMRQLAELEQELEQIRNIVATLRQQQSPAR